MRLIHLLPVLSTVFALPTSSNDPSTTDSTISDWDVGQWTSVHGLWTGAERLSGWSWMKAEKMLGWNTEQELAGGGEEDLTIWERLKQDPHSFSRLVKVIEFGGQEWIDFLNNKDSHLTFFAPNNDALSYPGHHSHHHHHGHDHDHKDMDEILARLAEEPSLQAVSSLLEPTSSFNLFGAVANDVIKGDGDDHDDEKNKERRRLFKSIIGKLVRYHTLPVPLKAVELAENSTVETTLKAADNETFGGLNFRLTVAKQLIPPAIKLNFYAKILVTDLKATNGYIHTLAHGLDHLPSIFGNTYLYPEFFSTFTSAVQNLHARHFIEWHDRTPRHHNHDRPEQDVLIHHDLASWFNKASKEHEHDGNRGTPLATMFIPTNTAFLVLPPRLKRYLFSPAGGELLYRILAWHYIPDSLLLSELIYENQKQGGGEGKGIEYFAGNDGPEYKKELDVKTGNQKVTLHIVAEKKKVLPIPGAYQTTIKVNGQQVLGVDITARNGAFHSIAHLIVPPHKHHDHDGLDISSEDTWENWEEWLYDAVADMQAYE